jgi:hypothetical protein
LLVDGALIAIKSAEGEVPGALLFWIALPHSSRRFFANVILTVQIVVQLKL